MLIRKLNTGNSLKDFSGSERWVLVLLTLAAAIIRISLAYNRPLLGDEVGTLIYTQKSISYILSHFETWLSLNYFIVLEKGMVNLFGGGSLSLGFFPLLAGIATVPLTASVAIRFGSRKMALIAAILTTMNPFLIKYSPIARSYSILAALSLLSVIFFLNWFSKRDLKSRINFSVSCFFMILLHPNGIYTLLFILILLGLDLITAFIKNREFTYIKDVLKLSIPLSISVLMILFSYAWIFPEMFEKSKKIHAVPPTSLYYLGSIYKIYFAKGYYGLITGLFLIAGSYSFFKKRYHLIILWLWIFTPIMAFSMQGIFHYRWAYARFLIFIIPPLIIVIAEGVMFLSQKLVPYKAKMMVYVFISTLIISWIPNIDRVFAKSKPPWIEVASFVKSKYKSNNIISAFGWGNWWQLQPYFFKSEFTTLTFSDYVQTTRFLINKDLQNSLPSLSSIQPLFSRTLFEIDTINKMIISRQEQPVILDSDKGLITIKGWAVDEMTKDAAGGVYIDIDGKLYPAFYGIDRKDVADVHKVTAYRYSGFKVIIPVSDVGRGLHTLSVNILTGDRRAYYKSSRTVRFKIETAHINVIKDRKLILVNATGFPLVTKAAQFSFGKIQIVVYPEADSKYTMEGIRNDLIKTVTRANYQVHPGLTELYSAILNLNKSLKTDEGIDKYQKLWEECYKLLPRYQPPLPDFHHMYIPGTI